MGSIELKSPATRATVPQAAFRANRAAMILSLVALLLVVAPMLGCGKKSSRNGDGSTVSHQNSSTSNDQPNGTTNSQGENRPRLPDVEPTGNTQTIDQMEVDELVQALGHSDLTKRLDAANVLAELGPEVVPDLIRALDADNYHVRAGAVFALGKLGATATPALDRLREIAADDEREVVRDAARFAIDAIEGG